MSARPRSHFGRIGPLPADRPGPRNRTRSAPLRGSHLHGGAGPVKRRLSLAAGAAVALTLAIPSAGPRAQAVDPAPAAGTAPTSVTAPDLAFILRAAQGGAEEVALGTMAADKADNAQGEVLRPPDGRGPHQGQQGSGGARPQPRRRGPGRPRPSRPDGKRRAGRPLGPRVRPRVRGAAGRGARGHAGPVPLRRRERGRPRAEGVRAPLRARHHPPPQDGAGPDGHRARPYRHPGPEGRPRRARRPAQ